MHTCYTGSRKVTYGQGAKIEADLGKRAVTSWHVGDAAGVDLIVRDYLKSLELPGKVYRAGGKQPWQLAQRSKEMVDSCAALGNAKLIAYPDKPCPVGVKPGKNFAGKGSGTWGTIAYAQHLGLEIEIVWLVPNIAEPDWMRVKQLSIF
jgi:hypothetical protein